MLYKYKKQNRKYHFLDFGTNTYLQQILVNLSVPIVILKKVASSIAINPMAAAAYKKAHFT
jgi:Ni,Fe-hydrogenase I cytochrome b subunit